MRGRRDNTVNRTGAVITAAGTGTRSGYKRACDELDGISMAARIVVNFQRAGVRDIVVVTGEQDSLLRKQLRGMGVVFLFNPAFRTAQMMDSVKMGVEYLKDRCRQVLICPADVPFFSEETVRRIISSKGDIVIPVFNGHKGHPVLVNLSLAGKILEYQGENGLKGALESSGKEQMLVTIEDEGVLEKAKEGQQQSAHVKRYQEQLLRAAATVELIRNKAFFGPELLTILRQIDTLKSVREACEKAGISYTKAWTLIGTAEEELGFRIIKRQQGGKTGGAAELTEEGRRLAERYDQLERKVQAFTQKTYEELFDKTENF